MMASGFSFGFVLDDEEAESSTSDVKTNAPTTTTKDSVEDTSFDDSKTACAVSPTTADRRHSLPFHRFDASLLQRLLTERALEEIIHDEIHVGDDYIVRRVDTDRASFVEPSSDPSSTTTADSSTTTRPPKLKLRAHHPSDLLPGVYEGGAAVWEGSLDLLDYLGTIQAELQLQFDHQQKQPTILELGCGHALPSLYLLQTLQPQVVVLTDYNAYVLKDVTISNLVLNFATQLDDVASRVVLGAGDWMDMSRWLLKEPQQDDDDPPTESASSSSSSRQEPSLPADGRFDIMLAAETLYTPQAAQETAYLVAHHLSHNAGAAAYIATKRYYFGVGGGTDAFVQCATTMHGLEVETVHVVDTGRGNVREVLKVTHRQQA
jgi:Lysine methyltransferase